jgi:hypothetical protein
MCGSWWVVNYLNKGVVVQFGRSYFLLSRNDGINKATKATLATIARAHIEWNSDLTAINVAKMAIPKMSGRNRTESAYQLDDFFQVPNIIRNPLPLPG